jgi:hypothetical protein
MIKSRGRAGHANVSVALNVYADEFDKAMHGGRFAPQSSCLKQKSRFRGFHEVGGTGSNP